MTSIQRKKLSYKNLDRDIERCCIETGETILGTPVQRGYYEAKDYVFNTYLEKKHYDAVLDYLLAQNWEWGANQYVERATGAFRQDREFEKVKRLWRSVIASQKQNYWATHAIRDQAPDVDRILSKAKKITLQHMIRYHEILKDLDDEDELSYIEDEIALLEGEKYKRKTFRPVPRKMDEQVFWELIEAAKDLVGAVPVQIDNLTSQLESFKASDIKVFQKILLKKTQAAYHWDLWALAFIAQEGCSDDAFADFGAWLILQGQETFQLACSNIRSVLAQVPAGLGTQAQGLHSVAAIAYKRRTGKELPPAKGKTRKLNGRPWKEDQLESLYPEVWKYYKMGE